MPQTVAQSAKFLRDRVENYVFISSGSAYADTSRPNYHETTRTATLDDEHQAAIERIGPGGELNGLTLGENYGALKVLCERAAEKQMPNRVLSVRAGMIVGAYDWTDRFAYWVMRASSGGEILAPGKPENFVQLIDARDLSGWIVKMIENGETGVYNATGKQFALTFGEMLDEMKAATGARAKFVWANEKFLAVNDVAAWSEMPFYLPESDANARHF